MSGRPRADLLRVSSFLESVSSERRNWKVSSGIPREEICGFYKKLVFLSQESAEKGFADCKKQCRLAGGSCKGEKSVG